MHRRLWLRCKHLSQLDPSRLPGRPYPIAPQLARVGQWFHAMSDTTRLYILELLSQGALSAGELHEILVVPRSRISFHLKVLTESGLIRMGPSGRRRFYDVCEPIISHMMAFTRTVLPHLDISRKVDTLSAMNPAVVAGWFHALADESRIHIVELLSHKERCVCDLERVLGIAQSKLSFHLKVLKDAGLVADRREGRWMYYSVRRETLDHIAAYTKSVKPGKHAGSCELACCD